MQMVKRWVALGAMLLMLAWGALGAQAQAGKTVFSGYVRDGETGEALLGASVVLAADTAGARVYGSLTNEYGFFSLTVPSGTYVLRISYVGYQTRAARLPLKESQLVEFSLQPEGTVAEAVEITAERTDQNVADPLTGRIELDVAQISKLPALFGEVDVLRTIQLLPGVTNPGEGVGGFFVRGGTFDQNLILLDEAPVYNATHLLGFFSVFNSDAIKDLDLYKGDIPARYGGRLSSLVDIRMKEGNNKRYTGSAGIGLLSSRGLFEGPIVKDKGSFLLSGRRTYADLFLAFSGDEAVRNNVLYFYDINAKANYSLGPNDRLYLSGYFGRDVFEFGDDFGFDWGNATATLRWNHVFNKKLFSNLTLIYSDFDYAFQFSVSDDAGARVGAGIRDVAAKLDLSYYYSPRLKVYAGTQVTYHRFTPGELEPTGSEEFFNPRTIDAGDALEPALYLDLEHQLTERLVLRYGLRYAWFLTYGPGETYVYESLDPELPASEINSVDTLFTPKGQVINRFGGLEPRFALRYTLTPTSSLKASYARTQQFIQVASNATASLPVDLWIPAGDIVEPQISDQIALGYFRNFKGNTWEASLEVYNRWLENQIDFRNGADLLLNEQLESQLLLGSGRGYGAELFVRKNAGKLTGWVSYTLAWARRRTAGIRPENASYPAKTDRRHNVNIVGVYELNKRWTFGATWVYTTGAAVTYPVGRYLNEGYSVPIYGLRNADRLPAYHRLDLSATLRPRKNEGRKIQTEWVFSAYNAYFRQNAFFLNFQADEDDPTQTEITKVYLFGIVPSVTYNIRF